MILHELAISMLAFFVSRKLAVMHWEMTGNSRVQYSKPVLLDESLGASHGGCDAASSEKFCDDNFLNHCQPPLF